jgi:hypothetical protein
MAERTITFDGAVDADPRSDVVEVGGLRFTVVAQGDWLLEFVNNRLEFYEDPNFGGLPFRITVTTVTGNLIKPISANYGYSSDLEPAGGFPHSLRFTTDTSTTTVSAFSGNTIDWQAAGQAASSSIRIDEFNPVSSENPTSYFWLDNFVVDTDTPGVDTTLPVVLSITRAGAASQITNASSVTYSVTFSEVVNGVSIDDFTLSGSGSAAGTLGTITNTGDGKTYIVTVNGVDGDGTLRLDLKNAGTGIVDASGNPISGGFTQGQTYTIDHTTPDTTIISGPPALTNSSSATFSFTSNESGVRFEWSLNGAAFTTTSGPQNITGLSDGSHTVAFRAIDQAGNIDATPATYSWAVDTIAPTTPAQPDLAPASDSGLLNTDNITNATTQTIRGVAGSADPGSEIRLYDGNNPTAIGSVTASADGSWSIDLSLAEGSHSITAKAFDTAGNGSNASQVLTVTVDRTAPAVPQTPVLATGSDTGISNSDRLTANDKPTFTGTAEAGATVTLYDTDGSVIGSGTAVGGTWLITPTVALGNGSHTITATARDAAGNVSAASGSQAITIDKAAPTLTITSDVARLKIDETAIITFTFSEDPDATFTRADVSVAGGTLSALSGTGLTRTAVFTPNAGVDGGVAGITVAAGSYTDKAGNSGGAGATPVLAFDTRAPAAPSSPDLDRNSDTGSSDSDNITGDTTPTFSGLAEVGSTVRLYDGATEIGSVVAIDGTWSITSSVLGAGIHTITAVATDPAGNRGPASQALEIHVVTDAPATQVSGIVLSADTGISASDLITRTASQTISGTLDAALAVGEHVEASFDGGDNWASAISSTGSAAWSLATTLAAGTHTISVRVTNAVEIGGPVKTQEYTLDTVAPGVTITSNVAQLKVGETATITFTFSEDPGATFSWDGSSGDVTVSGGTLSAISGSGLTRTAIFTPSAATNGGTASITVAAGSYIDLAGNNGTAGLTPSLRFDTLAPVAPTAPVLAAESDSGTSDSDKLTNRNTLTLTGTTEAGTTIRLYDTDGVTEVGSAVAIGGAWSITTSPLATGSHTLVARATDAAGNTSPVSTGLSVIIDRAAPTLVHISPVDDAMNVSTSANLALTFSEAIAAGSGTLTLHASNGTIVESFDVATSNRISIIGDVLALNPTSPFTSGTGYYLTISAGALTDAAGNSFAGFADNATFNFTTEGALVVPDEQGGHTITITDPGQLTADLGTSGTDTVLYAGSGTVALPNTVENIRLSGAGDANAVGNGLMNFFQGNAGDNLFDGAAGKDAIFYDVSLADVSLSYNADGTLTISGASIGTDTIKNIELLHFADQVVLADPPPAHTPGLFNEVWYLAQNPDVAAAVKAGTFSHGFEHFLRHGAQEGRAAAPGRSGWDEQFYLTQNPDVAAAVKVGSLASGFEHFLQFGAQEGRAATADGQGWDETFYLAHNPDVAAAVKAGGLASGLEHFLQNGGVEGRAADPQALGVDEAFYLAQNPDVAAAVQAGWLSSGMDHYFTWGVREGRDPNALFDEAWYLSHNQDVAAAVQAGSIASGYEHYRHFGWAEGRDASAWFDGSAYLAANPDVAAAQVDPLTHYLTYGVREGRMIVAASTDLWV